MGKTSWLQVAVACLVLSGCGDLVKTTQVVDGRQVIRWSDPQTAERFKQEEAQNAARVEAYRKAEMRKANDPIIVTLFETQVEGKLKQNVQGRLFEHFRKEFEGDPIIKLVDQKKAAAAEKRGDRLDSDVSVVSRAYLEKVFGRDTTTGKLGTGVVLAYEATVSSSYLPEDVYKVNQSGGIFSNMEVTHTFAEKIKAVIKNNIGPKIPKRSRATVIDLSDLFDSLKRKQ
jgi:hypothetical protein